MSKTHSTFPKSKFLEETTEKILIKPLNKVIPAKKEEIEEDILEQMDNIFQKVESLRPRLKKTEDETGLKRDDLAALLDISKAINSTLVLDEILQLVMKKAINLLGAERGFLMLLDENGELQFKTAHNISKESLGHEDFKISRTTANKVAQTGESIYTSDAQKDERYSQQKSVIELKLKSIMCVPLKSKEKTIGILYVDNSEKANLFLESDLKVFELFAGQAAIAIENAKLYENILNLKIYNENIVNRSPVGIVVVDRDLKITTLNTTMQEILKKGGWKNSEGEFSYSGLCCLELFPQEQKAQWKMNFQAVLKTGNALDEAKYYYRYNQDEELILSVKVSPLYNSGNEITGLIIVVEDITEKVLLEKYLILSEKLVAKGEMSASIGHELNNYLTIILNNAELLPLNLKKGNLEKADHSLKVILDSIIKMKRFTDGLMDFSQLETKLVNYQLKDVIDDILFSLKPQKKFYGINFVTQFDPNCPKILMDVGQIQQVFLNLINNACEAIKESGENQKGTITLTINYLSLENQVEAKVQDTGPGIAEENLKKLFETHFTTKEKGHGLGLVTCQKIIKNHGGEIKVESTLGQGTTFTITLLVASDKNAS